MKNVNLVMDNYKTEFDAQLKPACAGEQHADREEGCQR